MKLRTLVSAALFGFVALVTLLQVACGSSNSMTPTSPGGGGGGGGANVTIAIVGSSGSQSFSPNPATVPMGQTVAFKNNDVTTHHIVQDSGAFDTGALAPGAMSAPITISTSGALPFHCTIHPSMVGTINGSTAAPGGPGY